MIKIIIAELVVVTIIIQMQRYNFIEDFDTLLTKALISELPYKNRKTLQIIDAQHNENTMLFQVETEVNQEINIDWI